MTTRIEELVEAVVSILHCGCGGLCSLCSHQPRPSSDDEYREVFATMHSIQKAKTRRQAYAMIEHALETLESLRQTYKAQSNAAWVRLTEIEISGYMDAVAGIARATYADPREMSAYNEGYTTARRCLS